ncbi:alveolar macrophage chemotactic factor-like [Tachyglossus aculeatus]|uniref:alveolar macrophage chemotactic factor-like n=1 Tax=Tachyglossus aculeatus TaxID=9261 RepID=UPI0018F2984B|nr:alveolar macrophage chemotactic factor-like [Tachyglossus aculeatus]
MARAGAAPVLLLLLLGVPLLTLAPTIVRGFPMLMPGRCRCLAFSDGRTHPRSFSKLEVFPASPLCQQVEIIVTLKNGKTTCLKADSPKVKKLMTIIMKRSSGSGPRG